MIKELIGPAAEFAGSIASSAASLMSAREQMKFQERMSGSAHQREVADLIKAGINPIMTVDGGGGASTPSGASVDFNNPLEGMANWSLQKRMTALAENKGKEEINSLVAGQKVASATAAREASQTKVNEKQLNAIDAQIADMNSRARANSATAALQEQEYRMNNLRMPQLQNESEMQQTWLGRWQPYIHAITGDLNSASSLVGGFVGARMGNRFGTGLKLNRDLMNGRQYMRSIAPEKFIVPKYSR